MKYSAEDFKNAKFAEDRDGRVIARCVPESNYAWENNKLVLTDEEMAESGWWVPVPTKPTMTNSEVDKLVPTNFPEEYLLGFIDGFEKAGGEVIPDPEPTNTEKLAALIKEVQGVNYGWIAKYLNDHGVTAPKEDK